LQSHVLIEQSLPRRQGTMEGFTVGSNMELDHLEAYGGRVEHELEGPR
jgi:hypothetical protein